MGGEKRLELGKVSGGIVVQDVDAVYFQVLQTSRPSKKVAQTQKGLAAVGNLEGGEGSGAYHVLHR